MANNALIQGAAETGKRFLDVGGAVGTGIAISAAAASSVNQPPARTVANEAIQQKVNGYMAKMKTDMDFTSFTPAETKSMRGFLLEERAKYTDAAKIAAQFKDTTSPEYLNAVDIMQGVNNSFTNLASQLGSYKKGKVEYASAMQQGLFSNGNEPSRSRESMIAYGFYDGDGDGRSDSRYDSPFQIQEGGNIGFKVDGNVIDYGDMAEPFVKDTKFLNSLNKTSENAYNNGASGKNDNQYAQDSYDQSLDSALQNEDTLNSIIYDFKSEIKLEDVGKKLDNGTYTIKEARKEVKSRLLVARNQAFKDGASEYKAKQAKLNPPAELTGAARLKLKTVKDKTALIDNVENVGRIEGIGTKRSAMSELDGQKQRVYKVYDELGYRIERDFSKQQVADYLNLRAQGFNWESN